MNPRSIILLSGGLDSTLALVIAKQESDVVLALTFDYGQRSAKQEINAARNIADYFNTTHQVIGFDFFKNFQNNPLLNSNIALPQLKVKELDQKKKTAQSAKAVWIPNRNGVFINMAASIAEASKIDRIYTGFNAEEARTFPDNSPEFIEALNKSLNFSTLNHVTIKAPTVNMQKDEILKELIKYDFPVTMLWSCYDSQDKMCGECESCLRLKRALMQTAIKHHSEEMFLNV